MLGGVAELELGGLLVLELGGVLALGLGGLLGLGLDGAMVSGDVDVLGAGVFRLEGRLASARLIGR